MMVGELGQAPYPALCLPHRLQGSPPAKHRKLCPLSLGTLAICLGPWSSSFSSSPLSFQPHQRRQEVNATTFTPKKKKTTKNCPSKLSATAVS